MKVMVKWTQMWNWKCKFDPKDFGYSYVYEELNGVIVQS